MGVGLAVTVEKVSRTPGRLDTSYRVELRIFSWAGRVAQRANGAWIYLIDDRGRRYSPDPGLSAVPLDVLRCPAAAAPIRQHLAALPRAGRRTPAWSHHRSWRAVLRTDGIPYHR